MLEYMSRIPHWFLGMLQHLAWKIFAGFILVHGTAEGAHTSLSYLRFFFKSDIKMMVALRKALVEYAENGLKEAELFLTNVREEEWSVATNMLLIEDRFSAIVKLFHGWVLALEYIHFCDNRVVIGGSLATQQFHKDITAVQKDFLQWKDFDTAGLRRPWQSIERDMDLTNDIRDKVPRIDSLVLKIRKLKDDVCLQR